MDCVTKEGCYIYHIHNSMEHSPQETKSHSAKKFLPFMESRGSVPCSEESA